MLSMKTLNLIVNIGEHFQALQYLHVVGKLAQIGTSNCLENLRKL